jgi:methyl-accepting chemotaxis protein
MIKPDVKKNKETHNFMNDSIKLLEVLNNFNSEKMSESDEEILLENIDDFFSSFVYFRESCENKKSNIHHLSVIMEDVWTIAEDGNEAYKKAETNEEIHNSLLKTVNNITDKLDEIEKTLAEAEKDEQEFKRMETVEKVFLDTKMNVIEVSESFKTFSEDVKNNMTLMHDEMEQMENNLRGFENNTQEYKNNTDKLKQVGNEWNENFKNWQVSSNKKIEEGHNDLIEKINASTKEAVNNKDKLLENINSRWETQVDNMEKKCAETLFNVSEINESSKKLLFGEHFKQVFIYFGSAMSVINFFMLIAFMVLK